MKQVKRYEWLREKINGHRASKSHSNFFFLPQKIQAIIAEGKLFFLEDGQNLFLFEREPNFYRMYYFLGDLESAPEIQVDMPVVIEFPYRGAYSPAQKQEADYIQKLGFEIGERNRVMSVKAEKAVLPPPVSDQSIVIQPARSEECAQITELMYSCLDEKFSLLPNETEMLHLIDEGKIWTLYYDGALAAVVESELKGKVSWQSHLAVNPNYRNKGLGKALIGQTMRMHRDKAQEYMLWVDMDYTPAVRLHQKTGYTFTAKGADGYILQGKGEAST